MTCHTHSLKVLAAHLLGLGALVATPAYATTINNVLTVDGTATTTTTNTFGPSTNDAYISGSASSGAFFSGNYADASAWGNAYGTYRAAASGSGVFSSSSHFHRTVTLNNNNGYATDYTLNFFIYYGSLSANNNGVAGTGYGSYDLVIKMNGVNTLFSSMAKVDSDGVLTRGGTELNGASLSGGNYSWGGTNVSLNLGSLGINQSLTIDFDLVSTAYGNFATGTSCGGGYGNTDVPALMSASTGYGGSCTGSIYASLGDPNDFAENGQLNPPVNIIGNRSSTVPVPGTLALLGAGLLGLGLNARRSRR
ncbi:MAG TPA: PEP-CTERM sorting domain-containing protein [Accumulibacter sp.]|jgi:hypothetical protein|nr:PEP-CTERM sorting domain-containing protein [Accumulibacter sp.]